FNLTIDDNPEILQETKRAISTTSIPGQPPLFVEISLKTPESTLILELWSLTFKQELQEPNIRILNTVYNRMALLLRSVISVTRVIPAYKLSRMKTSDYIMCYNIYTADQQCDYADVLGQEFKRVELGTVGTPFGGLVFELSYRTRLEIIVPVNNKLMIKSDHYGNTGAKEIQTQPDSPAFPRQEVLNLDKADSPMTQVKTNPTNAVAAFEPNHITPVLPDDEDTSIPFSGLLKQSIKFKKLQNHNKGNHEKEKAEVIYEQQDVPADSGTSESSSSGGGDRNPPADFIMVDLKTPFAPSPAPSAGSGQVGSSADIDTELNTFEASLGEYDDFVRKLCGGTGDYEGSSSSGSMSGGPRFP
ncbi:unnamed protein product, partial [Allacma fusca]